MFEDDIFKQFKYENINFKGKKCLDIGTRNGLNCLNLINLGAKEVIGIDIDDRRFNELYDYINNNNISNEIREKIILKKINLLEMDENDKFDAITCFLWNMNYSEYNEIVLKIKLLLNEYGVIYIGLCDECYIYDENGVSVPKLFYNHFNEMRFICYNNIIRCQWILELKFKIDYKEKDYSKNYLNLPLLKKKIKINYI